MREARTLSREVRATAIPYGEKVPLAAGTTVYISQSLGGTFTVVTDMGYMVRIDAADADAIGEEVTASPSAEDQAGKSLEELVWDQLKTCYDPEIPVNIVDLGLVYEVAARERETGGKRVEIRFTLTAPGCGMGDVLKVDIEQKVSALPGVEETDVQIAFEPVWNQSMMSEAARLQLGLM
jgi:probable FeS assembly SUF system protein SufT